MFLKDRFEEENNGQSPISHLEENFKINLIYTLPYDMGTNAIQSISGQVFSVQNFTPQDFISNILRPPISNLAFT